jgi:hypothetical protein
MATKQKPPIKKWEIKDRLYILKSNKKPLVFTIPSRHSAKKPLLWFDEETGVQRELRYATNQQSPFVDEQSGESTLGHIAMRDGVLAVPKQKQNLQKLLSLYHPYLNNVYEEYDSVKEAKDELEDLELELNALVAAKGLDVETAEGVLRVEIGSEVSKMTTKEIKRDLLLFAKRNPSLFLELAADDDVQLRNFGVKAAESKIIKLSSDQRSFVWGSNGRKLMTVPFDEHPYSALAAFFKTDEGMEIYKNIEKRLK